MTTYWLRFTLLSDATFGRGDGVASVVDAEVQHDKYGLPYLSGRTLKGLLGYECADILFALRQQGKVEKWEQTAQRLFGNPGSTAEDQARMHVGDARLHTRLRQAVRTGVDRGELRREQVLESLTAIRQQTAVDAETGAPVKETLRAMRVILRQSLFEAELRFIEDPSPQEKALLAACVMALRRAGTARNRGRGEIRARIFDSQEQEITPGWFESFKREVLL